MKNVKETYGQINTWLQQQDSKKIKFLEEQSCYDNKTELGRLKETLRYHYTIQQYKGQLQYIFGEKKITLKEIGQYMLDKMGDYGPRKGQSREEFDEDCQHSGYADTQMFKEIKSFWKNLDEHALLAVASGSAMEEYEVDLDGYRCYFLSRSKVYPLIFNYIYYTLKKTPQELDEELCNSNDTFDAIEHLYPPEELFLPGADVIDRLYGKKSNEQTEKNIEAFKRSLNSILTNEQFKNEPKLADKMAFLKTIS